MQNGIANEFTSDEQKYFKSLNDEVIAFKMEIILLFDLYREQNLKVISLPAYGHFFNILRHAIQNSCVARFGRIVDAADTCGRDNISFLGLVKQAREKNDVLFNNDLTVELEELKDVLNEAKDFRNKFIAHNALDKEQVKDFNWTEIKNLVDNICKVMNDICRRFTNVVWDYEMQHMRKSEYSAIKALASYRLIVQDYFENEKKNPSQENPLEKYFKVDMDQFLDNIK